VLRAKIFGLKQPGPMESTPTKSRSARERLDYRKRSEPHYLTYGRKTRREFLNLLRWNGGSRA